MPNRKKTKTKKTTSGARKNLAIRRRSVPLYLLSLAFILLTAGFLSFLERKQEQITLSSGVDFESMQKAEIEATLRPMLSGYPMEQMIPRMMEKDPKIIAFLVSIAKKESNWGKRSPKYAGQDCFNYWGFRGPNRIGSGGHSCFSGPEDAVDIVAKRIDYLVREKDLDTPAKMIVWKCGSSCAGHSQIGVQKWISDVSLYFKKITHPRTDVDQK